MACRCPCEVESRTAFLLTTAAILGHVATDDGLARARARNHDGRDRLCETWRYVYYNMAPPSGSTSC